MTKKSIAVIGAGITGLMAAYYARLDGHKVTVYDQEPYSAMRCSYANGGQMSVSNSEVWTTWSNVYKGVKWLFKKDAPLLIRPQFSLSQWKWLFAFVKNTADGKYVTNTQRTIALGLHSRLLYKEIIERHKLKFDYSECGILHFYKDPNYMDGAKGITKEIYDENGVQWHILSHKDVSDIEPALTSRHILGGAWTPDDAVGDIHKFCDEVTEILKEAGVNFVYNTKINDKHCFRAVIDLYDYTIVSAGVGSPKIAKFLGDKLSIYPVKGYSITINVKESDMEKLPKVSLLDDKAKIVTSTLGNRFRVAGTAELAGENYDIRRDRIEPLLKWVKNNFDIDTSSYSSWACLRPMTPDMLPIVERSRKNHKVIYHTGHGHLGWTLSPATAKKAISLIE